VSVSMVEIIKALRILVSLICRKVFRKELIIRIRLLLLLGWGLISLLDKIGLGLETSTKGMSQ
jgi:hypothetical protein